MIKSMIKYSVILILFISLILGSLIIYNIAIESGVNGPNQINPVDDPDPEQSSEDTNQGPTDDFDIELVNSEETEYGFKMKAYSFEGEPINSQTIENKILQELNEYRVSNNINEFSTIPHLKQEARIHSLDMNERDFYSHENPDGQSPKDRIGDLDYCFTYSENIHRLYIGEKLELFSDGEGTVITNMEQLSEIVVDDWLASPSHKENIDDESLDKSGVGVYIDEVENGSLIVYITHKMCG